MRSALAFVVALTVFLSFSSVTAPGGQAPDRPKKGVSEGIPYRAAVQGKPERHHTLDLYRPPFEARKPPLLVFIPGGLWAASEDHVQIAAGLAHDLAASGVAVAVVRHRSGPEHRHPDQARDVAAALAHLFHAAGRHGYDPRRIYLSGHAAGAHLASLVALDGQYLAAHNLAPDLLAGVVGLSGIYNLVGRNELSPAAQEAILARFGPDEANLRDASPINHVKPGSPPFLLLSGSSDLAGFSIDARRFADALNRAAKQRTLSMVVSGRDHSSIVRPRRLDDPVVDLLLDFLNVRPLPPYLADLVEAKRAWLDSPASTLPFWAHKDLIRTYPVDHRFLMQLVGLYGELRHELLQWPLAEFHAIDLFDYLAVLTAGQAKAGEYLVTTNVRNEKLIRNLRDLKPYQPVIVVGLDDQQNLFQMSVFYRMEREYSWKSGAQPPTMARSLGAFVYFLQPPPPELRPESWSFALTADSFRIVSADPLAPLRDLTQDLHEVMTHRNGCVYCHSFRGAGSRSHHIRASDGAPHGGFALPLESYPAEVWKAFVFDQERVAEKMGTNPNVVEEGARQRIYELVPKYRTEGRSGP